MKRNVGTFLLLSGQTSSYCTQYTIREDAVDGFSGFLEGAEPHLIDFGVQVQ
jgi:hypothetical protein